MKGNDFTELAQRSPVVRSLFIEVEDYVTKPLDIFHNPFLKHVGCVYGWTDKTTARYSL